MKCNRCKREFTARGETISDDRRIIKIGKTYAIKKRKYIYATRPYCAYCGAWKR